MRDMERDDAIWMGAMMDAEGWFSSQIQITPRSSRPQTHLIIGIANRDKHILAKAERIMGQVYKQDKKNNGCFDYVLTGGSQAKIQFLRDILPHLEAKKLRALFSYAFSLMVINVSQKEKLNDSRHSDFRQALCKAIQTLNHEGEPYP